MPGGKTNISPSTLLLFDGVTEKVTAPALQSVLESPLTFLITDTFYALQLGGGTEALREETHTDSKIRQGGKVSPPHLFQFMEEKGPGLASLLYSIVMSKGIEL